jgi:hypothetical protein
MPFIHFVGLMLMFDHRLSRIVKPPRIGCLIAFHSTKRA